jgi:CubicO group peptidase (beta-lactamase class C family)
MNYTTLESTTMFKPLPTVAPAEAGMRAEPLERLCAIIQAHIDEQRYPGAHVAVARNGKLVLHRSFGAARIDPRIEPASDRTVWRMYSNTKVIVAAAIRQLAEQGLLSFHDRVADHIPEFARHGKSDITVHQVLSHRAGFPLAGMAFPASAWEHPAVRRELVCDFTLEWTPGTRVRYHHMSAHWIAAVLVEALSGEDYRTYLRTALLEPLGLDDELYVGLPDSESARSADVHDAGPDGKTHIRHPTENEQPFRRAGLPATGGMATARALAAFYQMLVNKGALNGARVLSRRTVEYVTRDFTGEEVDLFYQLPMHRGLGPHGRGRGPKTVGLGTLAAPETFGHGGVGTSYVWGDPESGVSYAFLSNSRVNAEWNERRHEILSNCVHCAIE